MSGLMAARKFISSDKLDIAGEANIWQGTDDAVYSVPNAEQEIRLFANSPDARVVVVPKGQHFLSFSHPKEVDGNLIEFVSKYANR